MSKSETLSERVARLKTGDRIITGITYYDETEPSYDNRSITTIRVGDDLNGFMVEAIDVKYPDMRNPHVTILQDNGAFIELPDCRLFEVSGYLV